MNKNIQKLKDSIGLTYDWPVKGVVFKDLIPMMSDPKLMKLCTKELIKATKGIQYDTLLSAESRGFWFSIPIALKKNKWWVPCRKKGKMPGKTVGQSFKLEYGTATLEVQEGALKPGMKVLVIDDLLATGGTVDAMIKLAKKCGAEVVGTAFVVDLTYLKGGELIKKNHNIPVISLIQYDSE
ncbi:MAG: adenine phosphoribosyltransferase [Malacoplasma sp.]|nr:adenine phosphoribosyltransferase [Malacoplasma sp.]